MVHISKIELSHFKSFGGTTSVPFRNGFTVVSGPNGSGKSNILDALLFCLGLASSKGMRAERLPDLINHNQSHVGRAVETRVTVTFDLSDLEETVIDDFIEEESSEIINPIKNEFSEDTEDYGNYEDDNQETSQSPAKFTISRTPEWSVTRRLRVTKGGSYSSNFYINDTPCTATELHEQLRRLRIYPEGYNVVLQGDVTSIISMNSKERRQIIDELAGVAEFDRKIEQTKETLESVKEREERCQIIEQELKNSLEKLATDRIKAEKYQKLKAIVLEKQQWEIIIKWRFLVYQQEQLLLKLEQGEKEKIKLQEGLILLDQEIKTKNNELEELNNKIKALGEDEQLSVASTLASQKAKRHQLQQRQQELKETLQNHFVLITKTEQEIKERQQDLTQLNQEKTTLETDTLPFLLGQKQQTQDILTTIREQADSIAEASEAWVQEQSALTRQISTLQQTFNPLCTEQAQLQERTEQLQSLVEKEAVQLTDIKSEIKEKEEAIKLFSETNNTTEKQIQELAKTLNETQQELDLQKDTQERLLREQREKQRQLDKLEAASHAEKEAQGTYASQLILSANLSGVHGLVAQLGQVDQMYQLALEVAAGGRLGQIVVETDEVGAIAIEILKQKKGGRATFLPLNKIKLNPIQKDIIPRYTRGFIDFAVNLISCEAHYEKIFNYVFGSTVVFQTLDDARNHLGKARIVTLGGELLESSGAMTGGSINKNSGLHFGTVSTEESGEIKALKSRLQEIGEILAYCFQYITEKSVLVNELTHKLTEIKQEKRENQLRLEQLEKELNRLLSQQKLGEQLQQHQEELELSKIRLIELNNCIPVMAEQLQQLQHKLAALEASQSHSEWQEIQKLIKVQEGKLQEKEITLRSTQEKLKTLENQVLRLQEKNVDSEEYLQTLQNQKTTDENNIKLTEDELVKVEGKIKETNELLDQLSEKLKAVKEERNNLENKLKELQNNHQKQVWNIQKLEEDQQERKSQGEHLTKEIQDQETDLPDPLPEVPILEEISLQELSKQLYEEKLEELQKEIRKGQKKLEALEPVNMLALEEYQKTEERLNELTEKLNTLVGERTELLLRVERFTTLRFKAFKESFDAVNENFKTIFATLSEGDGYLDLDNQENPFEGGLNLVAHPKGKPVQRLSSMSGGEKSLTALSFIFSLQRYRPSPFYAFDEVDMFLDGANVERLSKMIKQQAQQAQFIVVSLRRPMIEASERTIGVTQARGAYTQVLGIQF
jgi:chromosome segregation protein